MIAEPGVSWPKRVSETVRSLMERLPSPSKRVMGVVSMIGCSGSEGEGDGRGVWM